MFWGCGEHDWHLLMLWIDPMGTLFVDLHKKIFKNFIWNSKNQVNRERGNI